MGGREREKKSVRDEQKIFLGGVWLTRTLQHLGCRDNIPPLHSDYAESGSEGGDLRVNKGDPVTQQGKPSMHRRKEDAARGAGTMVPGTTNQGEISV